MTVRRDSMNEESKQHHTIQSLESKGECLVSNRCSSELDPQQALISNVKSVATNCRDLYIPNSDGFQSSIPKHITISDDKHVLQCLELIRDYAFRAEAWTLTLKARISPDDSASYDMVRIAKDCPLVNSSGECTLGRITDIPSMIHILKSPLLQQFGSIDANSQATVLCDAREPAPCNVADIRQKLISTMLDKSQKEATLGKSEHVSLSPVHRRVVSVSSTNTICSDRLSSSESAASFQGMLQSVWHNGVPHHVFSVDDKREVYVANCYKVASSEDKALDYVYSFHSRRRGKELDSVAVMRVSTSISFCPDSSELRETKFILSVSDNETDEKLQVPNQTHRKNERSTMKSSKQRSFSKFLGSSSILEDAPWDASEDAQRSNDLLEDIADRSNALKNHEQAAIVVKEISKNCRECDTGGWGLRFLKKSSEHLLSESTTNTEECSTSMNVLIPAGLHGGPKLRCGGGPSSLIERWTSGGCCDCGGWDIGCPLTVLSTQSSSLHTLSSQVENSGQCKSVDLFTKGSRFNVLVLKMVNIHEGLFSIHFQSTLSSLQSFAIAAAIIHSRSPSLRAL